jgi:methylase of polypeptide subunit release factors
MPYRHFNRADKGKGNRDLKTDVQQFVIEIRDRIERAGRSWFFHSRQRAIRDQVQRGAIDAADVYRRLLQTVFLSMLGDNAADFQEDAPIWRRVARPRVATGDGLRDADVTELAATYETLLSLELEIELGTSRFRLTDRRAHRKSTGSFYTPDAVVSRLLDAALEPALDAITKDRSGEQAARELLSLRVCDPACGAGYVLIAAARRVADRLSDIRGKRPVLRSVVSNCIFGVDIDRIAVALCRAGLCQLADIETLDPLREHIVIGDSLRNDEAASTERGFDVVLGNPPWVSYSGRQAARGEDVAELVARYPEIASWPCTHAAFVLHANRITKPTGRWGYVLPLQASFQDGYRQVRQTVEASGRSVSVHDVGELAFPGVSQAAGVFSAGPENPENPPPASVSSVWRASISPSASGAVGGDDELSPAVFGQLASLPKMPPGTFSDPGVHSGNMAKWLFKEVDAAAGVDESWAPVREGKDIGAFYCGPPRRRMNTSPETADGQYCRIGTERRYLDTPILIRQTANRPIAARHCRPHYFRNSLLACAGIEGVPDEVVVAVLNSSLIAMWYRQNAPDAGQRTFPQIKVRQLRELPMFDISRRVDDLPFRIVDLVHRAEAAADRAHRRHPSQSLMRDLELAVRQLYGVDDMTLASGGR